MQENAAIELKEISFAYGTKSILKNFNLKVQPGSICCLVGSSGSGKTTTLRLINGLLKPNSGNVFLDGTSLDFSKSEEARREMGYSIQGSGLFPHMTLFENLTIIARKKGWDKKKLHTRVQELCELMSLPSDKNFLNKKPREISGGQQQRVGIARALFLKPKIMLMDEPFSALDPITRSEIQKEFLRLQKILGLTIVLVTHDLSEAFSMGHEIVLLNSGKIEQQGKPSRFLLSPASPYVEEFMASHSPGNLLKEIFLYSVVNSQLYSSFEDGGKITLKNLESLETAQFDTLEQASAFLQEKGQNSHYWVDQEGNFDHVEDYEGNTYHVSLIASQHILDGMKTLLAVKASTLPIVSESNKLMGVFSEEALGAL